MSKTYDVKSVSVVWGGRELTGYANGDRFDVSIPDEVEVSPWIVSGPTSFTIPLVRVGPAVNIVQILLSSQRRWKRGQKLNRGGRRRARAKHAAELRFRRWLPQFRNEVATLYRPMLQEILMTEAGILSAMGLDTATGQDLDALGGLIGLNRKGGGK